MANVRITNRRTSVVRFRNEHGRTVDIAPGGSALFSRSFLDRLLQRKDAESIVQGLAIGDASPPVPAPAPAGVPVRASEDDVTPAAPAAVEDEPEGVTLRDSKAAILAHAEALGLDVDHTFTKRELMEAIESA